MGILGNALKGGVLSESLRATGGNDTTVAKVTRVDEANNVCSIEFINKDGKRTKIEKAMVDLRNKDWFPSNGDFVQVRVTGKTALIEQKYTEDYNKDIRSKQQLNNDITEDDDGTCSGSIF